MKLLILVVVGLFSSALFANDLKSDELRAKACYLLEEALSDDGLELEYKDEWGDKSVEIVSDFNTKCEESKSSFVVSDSIFNEELGKLVIMAVSVDLELKNEISFTGSLKFSRKVSLDSKGQIELGKWVGSDINIDYKLGNDAVDRIAEVIMMRASRAEGGGISKYDTTKFSVAKQLKALDEEEAEKQDEYSCKMMPHTEDDDISGLTDADDQGRGSVTPDLVKLLQKRGHLEAVLYSEVEEWEESCAYFDFYIYLKNGNVIFLGYDFTT